MWQKGINFQRLGDSGVAHDGGLEEQVAHFSPEEAFESLKKRTSETIKNHFPVKGASHTLEAKRVWVEDSKSIDDIREQKDVKLKGRSWTVPIKAELELKDDKGKVVDRQVINVAQLPKITRRYSYIVNGNEWQVNNLFRLKSGVYTRRRRNGELTSQWNLAKGSNFNMDFNPKSKKMTLRYNEASIPLYPVLKTMGVDDDTIERAWGKEILTANKKDKEDTALRKFYRAIRGSSPDTLDEAKDVIRERFEATQLRPESTEITLGTPFTTVNGSALLTGSNRILKVARQEEAPDDHNQLQFKELHSAEDLINERLSKWQTGRDVRRKIGNTVDKHSKIRNIVSPDIFGKPLRNLFVSSTLSENPEQTNPVSFLVGNRKTTLFAPGEGGIGSTHQIATEAQALNPSHLGFLDPIQTPECYDSETEVFTYDGWKKWPDVNDSDLFACRVYGKLEFHRAEKLHASQYTGSMYGLDSGKIHYLVTPNHRVHFSTVWRPDVWRIDRADRVHGKERSFDCGHEASDHGEPGDMFALPEVSGSNAVKNHTHIDMVDWAEFMGWYLSEGSVSYCEESSNYLVRISQLKAANPGNWGAIEALLSRLPQTWGHDSECKGFHTHSKQLASYLSEFGYCDEKFIPEYLFDAALPAREALFEALLLGDGRLGSKRSDGRSYDQRVFTTTSSRLADGFERLAIGLGHSVTHKIYADKREDRYLDVHEVRVLRHRIRTARPRHPYYPAEYFTVDYDGMVYCATVPGGLLLVRRSGGVGFWCGNSDRIGVTLQMSSHAEKVGHDLVIPVYNVKKGRTEKVTPFKALKSNLAFPDQYNWSKGKPQPVRKSVKVSDKDGTVTVVKPTEVDYVIRSSKGMFDLAANMIPFLQNNQGNRTMVASKQLEQALSLKNREAPLVQTRTDNPRRTFEEGIGAFVGHTSNVDGTVSAIKNDGIIIKDSAGKKHEVQIYDDFPLNDDKSALTSTPLVKVGDKVKKGQPVADTNFTQQGALALGTNLNVAYMPYKGYNFEDGIVVSESAAKKLTSEHMLREAVAAEKAVKLDKKKFLSYMAGKVTKDQADKLDDNAVIKEGELVNKDDVIIGLLKEEAVTPDEQKLGLFSKGLVRPWKPREVRWTKDEPGRVSKVVRHGKKTTVYIKTEAPAGVGDKIVGRHGNKGIITNVLPDHEMPQRADGSSVDVLLNPTGVPTRINLGQVLETSAAKIAQKTGKPYVVNNFDPGMEDYTRSLQAELKAHGISETEDLFDPLTKRKYPKVLTGPQYIMKLHHTAEKGLSVRSRHAYDSNMLPQKGGPQGGQTMDSMGLYAMLAHDARENIREMQTYKSDMNDSFWAQLQAGDPVPAPKTPFVFKKFEAYLKGMGLDTRKEGNDLILQPLTDKKTLEMSNGALADPARTLRAKDAKEEPGGIFDPKVTGGARGKKWSHIVLPERMPNPVFESPVSSLLGLNQASYKAIVKGEREFNGKTGPGAIVAALKGMNTASVKKDLEAKIPTLRTSHLDKANKQLKYLRALDRAGMSPSEAYTMKYLPVLPPQFRPFTILDTGNINYEDVNRLYNHIGTVNLKFADFDKALPPEEKLPLQTALYDGLKAVSLTGHIHQGRHRNSIIETIASPADKQPKEGYFQDKVIGRRQDLSMRGTIVPEPSLSLDEVGLPRKAAMELYKPFVVRRLTLQGGGLQGGRPLVAQNMVKENHPAAVSALEAEIRERPIMLKRDPVLHKFGVQSFRPKLVEGKAIKIHPLATAGYNADFDGDKMSAFLPVSPKAVKEAYKMLPSNNLFNPSTGLLISKPEQEAMLGLYKLTEVDKKTGKRFRSAADAALAVKKGEIGMNDLVTLDSLDGDLFDSFMKKEAAPIKTTVGRAMLYQSLPPGVRDERLLSDQKYVLNKDNLYGLLTDVAKKTPGDFGVVSDKFKDVGNEFATGLSIGLEDFVSDGTYRDAVLREAGKKESAIRSKTTAPSKKREQVVGLYVGAADKITNVTRKRADAGKNRMYDWVKSGARGSWDQFKQMTVSPVLVGDSNGEPVPIPIPKSYSEGLDIGSYFASMHGARMGTIGRVQGTQAPGKMSKQLINSTMNQLVVSEDCGTTKGVVLDINSRDLLDRYIVRDVRIGKKGGTDKGTLPAGTLVTPDVINRLKNNKISKVEVRSTLKCAHGKGLCSKCYGVNEEGAPPRLGSNLGIVAAQALGEPATQLAMNAFHTGGVVGAKGTQATGLFHRLEQLLNVPKTLPGAATLADAEGTVSRVEKDLAAGGWRVHVSSPAGRVSHYVPATRKLTVTRGTPVKMGDALSSGPKNPRELLRRTNMNAVQKYLTDEIWNAYKDEGPVRRRNVETFVRSMTNLAEVTDPGDHESLMRGDLGPTSEISSFNRKLVPGGKPVQYRPVLQGINMLPLEMQTDWLARMQSSRLKSTILDASAEGWRSMLHSTHPIPGMAYGKEFGKGTADAPWLY